MKIYIKDDSGAEIEVREIQSLNSGDTLILSSCAWLKPEETEILEKHLSFKTEKNVVILDPRFKVVGTV